MPPRGADSQAKAVRKKSKKAGQIKTDDRKTECKDTKDECSEVRKALRYTWHPHAAVKSNIGISLVKVRSKPTEEEKLLVLPWWNGVC